MVGGLRCSFMSTVASTPLRVRDQKFVDRRLNTGREGRGGEGGGGEGGQGTKRIPMPITDGRSVGANIKQEIRFLD